MLAVAYALGSAFMYALASVLQHKGASAQPDDQSLKLGLLVRLLRNPAWLAGLACDVAGYALQFVALGQGPMVVVQPVLVCGLLFALPIGAAWAGRRLAALDWLAAVMVCAGLGVFLAVADPATGRDDATLRNWTLLLAVVAAASAVLVLFSRGRAARRRSLLLSGAAGVAYGAAAALTKTSYHLLGGGVVHAATHWQPYALLVVGGVGMLLSQSAFQAGALDVSLPAMSVVDPIVSIAIGALVFGETVATGALDVLVEVVSLAVMSAGVVILARAEAAGAAETAGAAGAAAAARSPGAPGRATRQAATARPTRAAPTGETAAK